MSDKTELSVFELYKNKAEKARNDADERSRLVWAKDKRIEEIDRELSGIGMEIFGAALLGDEKREAEYKRLQNKLALLRAEKKDRLLALGLDEHYTDVKYECEKCSDTGYVGIKMCDCLKKTVRQRSYKNSGIGKYLESHTFENFDLSLYEFGEKRNLAAKNFKGLKQYAEEFSESTTKSLIIMGSTGLGKTHLSAAVAKVVIEKGFSVYYDSAQNIISTFERERFLRDDEKPVSDRYFDCDLLIIDDLGAEVRTKNSVSYFYTLINTRLISGKPVIVSTNLDGKGISANYDNRIASRLLGEYDLYFFEGKDLRGQKNR
ncbi:MAG: ATP-binding protein [Clostridia bacterium]|nr:ATP-binding protein [Clostridia bacterium]